MSTRLSSEAKTMLLAIAAATAEAPVFVDTASKEFQSLKKADFVLTNETSKDANGHTNTILNDAGKEKAKSYAPSETTRVRTPSVDPSTIEIETGVTMPVFKRGGTRRAIYPFDKMEAGQSFFIPSSAERPNPVKSMSSSITSHNAKLRKKHDADKAVNPNAPEPAVFKVGEGEKDGVKGARVFRVS